MLNLLSYSLYIKYLFFYKQYQKHLTNLSLFMFFLKFSWNGLGLLRGQ